MSPIYTLCSLAVWSLAVRQAVGQTCETYGIDFVSGGSYFINSQSDVAFTAVQEFSGCQNDTANNILVDPNGDQSECSDTIMVPDYTQQTLTCSSVTQNDMFSGEWSILIISNNGDAAPIDYQREFSLSVGPQQTTTYTPTVTATVVSTPVTTQYFTTTDTVTTTLVAKTTTKKVLFAMNGGPNLSSFLLPSIHTVTDTVGTITQTLHAPKVATAAATAQASCRPPNPNFIADPKARIVANFISARSSILDNENSAKFARAIRERKTVDEQTKAKYVVERRARLAEAARIQKRSPDQPTSTSTLSVSSDFVTSTSTSTAATSTVSLTTTTHVTSTSTPPVVTVTQALISVSLPTILFSMPAITITDFVLATQTATQSVPTTVTITSTTASSKAIQDCHATGGAIWW